MPARCFLLKIARALVFVAHARRTQNIESISIQNVPMMYQHLRHLPLIDDFIAAGTLIKVRVSLMHDSAVAPIDLRRRSLNEMRVFASVACGNNRPIFRRRRIFLHFYQSREWRDDPTYPGAAQLRLGKPNHRRCRDSLSWDN